MKLTGKVSDSNFFTVGALKDVSFLTVGAADLAIRRFSVCKCSVLLFLGTLLRAVNFFAILSFAFNATCTSPWIVIV